MEDAPPALSRLALVETELGPDRLWNGPAITYLDLVIDGLSLRGRLPDPSSFFIVSVLALKWRDDAVQDALRLLGRIEPDVPPDRVTLYVCPVCGDPDCGRLIARLRITDDVVIWDDVAWQYPDPDLGLTDLPYPGVGPFTFERSAYEAVFEEALMRLESAGPR